MAVNVMPNRTASTGLDKGGKEGNERLTLRERDDCFLHNGNTEEQHTKAQNDLAHMLNQILFNKEVHNRANKQNQRGIGGKIEGGDLSGDRCANIGTHNDANSLSQIHQSGIDESDHHHVRGRGALDHHRNRQADDHGDNAILCCIFQNDAHLFTGGIFQAAGHDRHAEQK